MRHALLTLFLSIAAASAVAQGDVEYRAEIGGGLGLINYLGDYNGKLLKSPQPMATVLVRKLFNPYTGVRFAVGAGKLKGSSKDEDTYYPGSATTPYDFSSTLIDGNLTFEYNFWPYGTGRDYRGAQRLTPFLFIGLGATYVKTGDDNVFTGNLPIGLGVKYKMADRLNLGVEWGIHFTLSDELDGSKDPYLIKSSGLFKNTDCYSALKVTLTYSFMAKCRTCHNADE
jgi:hypothetical protein